MTIRRSGLGQREVSGPPIVSYGALVSVGRPRWVTSEASRERAKVRVHVVRMGGRSRFDASRVFFTGRSQGRTVGKEGASWKEIRSTA